MAIYKNKIVPFSKVVEGKIVARSGSQVISKELGLPIQEFEYSTKSLDNVICAMQRHLSAKTRPDPVCINEFDHMTD